MSDTPSPDSPATDKPDTPVTPAPPPEQPTVTKHPRRRSKPKPKPKPKRKRPTRRQTHGESACCPPCPRHRNDSMALAEIPVGAHGVAHRNLLPPLPAETPGWRLGANLLGASVASIGGALATRWGWHPTSIAGLVTAAGAIGAWQSKGIAQSVGTGVLSAGGSQLTLLLLQKTKENQHTKDSPQGQAPKPPDPKETPQRRQAAGLAPGALDAAFERARAAMTLDHDEHDYAPHY